MKTLCGAGRRGFGRRMKWQKHQVLFFQFFCPVHFPAFPKNRANEPEKFSGKRFLSVPGISSQTDAADGSVEQVLRKSFKMNLLQKYRLLSGRGESGRIKSTWPQFTLTHGDVCALKH